MTQGKFDMKDKIDH